MTKAQDIEVRPDGSVVCGWFVGCDNTATGVVEHPIVGYVATCPRCAQLAGQRLLNAEWRHNADQ